MVTLLLPRSLTCCSAFLISSFVKIVFFGSINSTLNGRPLPKVLTSTSSRPEDENLASWAKVNFSKGSVIISCTELSILRLPSIIHGVCGNSLDHLLYLPAI
uniref:Putative secreted protein n=1 Tax=Panstrongylus lignarius TaxID=156445 RepID=A0A224XQQ0_9HEMI